MIMQLQENDRFFFLPGSVNYREHHIPVPDSDVARWVGDTGH